MLKIVLITASFVILVLRYIVLPRLITTYIKLVVMKDIDNMMSFQEFKRISGDFTRHSNGDQNTQPLNMNNEIESEILLVTDNFEGEKYNDGGY